MSYYHTANMYTVFADPFHTPKSVLKVAFERQVLKVVLLKVAIFTLESMELNITGQLKVAVVYE